MRIPLHSYQARCPLPQQTQRLPLDGSARQTAQTQTRALALHPYCASTQWQIRYVHLQLHDKRTHRPGPADCVGMMVKIPLGSANRCKQWCNKPDSALEMLPMLCFEMSPPMKAARVSGEPNNTSKPLCIVVAATSDTSDGYSPPLAMNCRIEEQRNRSNRTK